MYACFLFLDRNVWQVTYQITKRSLGRRAGFGHHIVKPVEPVEPVEPEALMKLLSNVQGRAEIMAD